MQTLKYSLFLCHMKGARSFHNLTRTLLPELFPEPVEAAPASDYDRKVEMILARYYYYTTNSKELGFTTTEKIVEKLRKEFCISAYQITQIIKNNTPAIHKLREQKPDKSFFKLNWSHLVW